MSTNKPGFRTESDSLGPVQVPAEALYGAQTQRAVDNFPISGRQLPLDFLDAVVHIKAAAAQANARLGCLDADIAAAISSSARQLLDDPQRGRHFPVDVFQTGSGTSTNMNVNEVLASLATAQLGRRVHPNDHVNFGQSSNDVIPSAIHLAASLQLGAGLLPALGHLRSAIDARSAELADAAKTGRTHLMDAMPVTLGQSLSGWSSQLTHAVQRLKRLQPALGQLALGGTAVGTGINTHADFARTACGLLSQQLGFAVVPADNYFAALASQDTAVSLSGELRTLAVALMKIANDLRWMNSGPLAGLGEITLPALQPGSSIMPGKVNPVIPEAVAMVCAQVMGNDSSITCAGQSGSFELNVMLPLVADRLLDSLALLSSASQCLADKCITGFTVNSAALHKALARNPVLATALNPVIGYEAAAKIAKQAYQQQRPVIDVAEECTDLDRAQLEALLDPLQLTRGGL